MALPADRTQMLEDLARRKADQFEAWEDELWEKGLGIFGKAKPIDRLKWYMAQTLPADFGYVLDLDYREKRKQGLTGPLMVEIQFEQYRQDSETIAQAQQEAEAMKIPLGPEMVPQIQPPPMMWVQLMGMSGRFMAKVQSDFRQLLNEQAKREGLVEPRQAPAIAAPVEAGY